MRASATRTASGTALRRHQSDALAGMLTELIAASQRYDEANGNGNGHGTKHRRLHLHQASLEVHECVHRDALLGRDPADWDLATDARPDRILALFPGAVYENRFGTVLALGVEITTFRRDHHYPDHRRPAEVTFTDDLREDLDQALAAA